MSTCSSLGLFLAVIAAQLLSMQAKNSNYGFNSNGIRLRSRLLQQTETNCCHAIYDRYEDECQQLTNENDCLTAVMGRNARMCHWDCSIAINNEQTVEPIPTEQPDTITSTITTTTQETCGARGTSCDPDNNNCCSGRCTMTRGYRSYTCR